MKKLLTICLLFCFMTSMLFAGNSVKQNPTNDKIDITSNNNVATVTAKWTIDSGDIDNLYHYEFGFTDNKVTIGADNQLPSVTWKTTESALTTVIDGTNTYKGTGSIYAGWIIRTTQNVTITISTTKMKKNNTTENALDWKIFVSDPDMTVDTKSASADIDTATNALSKEIHSWDAQGGILQTDVGSKKLTFETHSTTVAPNDFYTADITMTVTNV